MHRLRAKQEEEGMWKKGRLYVRRIPDLYLQESNSHSHRNVARTHFDLHTFIDAPDVADDRAIIELNFWCLRLVAYATWFN